MILRLVIRHQIFTHILHIQVWGHSKISSSVELLSQKCYPNCLDHLLPRYPPPKIAMLSWSQIQILQTETPYARLRPLSIILKPLSKGFCQYLPWDVQCSSLGLNIQLWAEKR
ncbi:hypothetical protein ACFX1S_040005 [Malus domestica]